MNRAQLLSLILWASVGVRLAYDKCLAPDTTPAPLRIPLSQFPMDELGPGWKGEDVPLEEAVERLAGTTSYLQRTYRRDGQILWFYVGYVGGWSPESLHHPGVCFPGNGLELEQEKIVTISPHAPKIVPPPGLAPTLEGKSSKTDFRFKEFLWRNLGGGGTFTLSTFYYHGKFEPEEWRVRADRIIGIRYFAVITISGAFSGSAAETRDICYEAVRKAVPRLLEHFPE